MITQEQWDFNDANGALLLRKLLADEELAALRRRIDDIMLGNRTDIPRRAFSVCYMSGATRCLRKKRAPRAFFPVFAPR